ncbi:mycothiol transferase [Leucobacter tenebrionis]|uniref:mycothiol transferase n=1 Tax=Leucobacter tenebrionis TaxID=2873270 RepID=UPI001CA6BB4F|nr:DUF664 domain-containing protein [Leucobacter tenebrionis]QZY50883.1 DinB family protein [Leucobacter tenebrionis]
MAEQTPSERILIQLILDKLDQLIASVGSLDDELANSALQVPGSNSPMQILVHCCGMLRWWSSSVNLGLPRMRDRDAEFETRLTVDEGLELASQARKAFLSDAAATELQRPPKAMPGGGDDDHHWLATAEGVLLHVLEELSQHLGQLEITIDVLRGSSSFDERS